MVSFVKKIPTFIINLERRCDRRIRVLNEFIGRNEFNVTVMPAIEHPIGAYGLSQTFLKIIKSALDNNEEFILICEDDHIFTSDYNPCLLYQLINSSNSLEADVLAGGPSWFDHAIKVHNNLLWLSAFTGAQFLIVFKRFYKKICDYNFSEHEHIDLVISNISDQIFSTTPLLSIQNDFAYSDVSPINNRSGAVNKLYNGMIARLAGLNKIFSLTGMFENLKLPLVDDESLQISTYIINLPERTDRLAHVKEQFAGKKEFELSILEACRNERGALGLWNSIKRVVKHAKDVGEDVIIICEDDHTFSKAYSREMLFRAIIQGAHLGADLILGGISNTLQAIVVSPDLCWIDTFLCAQFTIVYASLFDDILEEDFDENDVADLKLSSMTPNKYVIHPFVSTQKDFGYSDIPIDGVNTAHYQDWFNKCEQKLDKIRLIYQKYNSR